MYSPGTLLPPSRNSPSTFPWMRSSAARAWFLSFSTAPACSYSNHPVEVRSNLPPERLKSLHPSCCSRLWDVGGHGGLPEGEMLRREREAAQLCHPVEDLELAKIQVPRTLGHALSPVSNGLPTEPVAMPHQPG